MRAIIVMGLALLAGLPAVGCGEAPNYAEMVPGAEDLAVRFTEYLANRNYYRAYLMLAQEQKDEMSMEAMVHRFEQVFPPEWESYRPVEVARTLNDWADRRVGDILWYEMTVPGPDHDENITFVVTYDQEEEKLRIRSLEFVALGGTYVPFPPTPPRP